MKIIIIITACLFGTYATGQTKIALQDLSKHAGEKVTVCAKVYGIKYLDRSGTTFINVGAAYPSSPLTIVIFKKDRSNFAKVPEQLYSNKNICVTGTLTQYKGKAEIIVSKPDAITVQ